MNRAGCQTVPECWLQLCQKYDTYGCSSRNYKIERAKKLKEGVGWWLLTSRILWKQW